MPSRGYVKTYRKRNAKRAPRRKRAAGGRSANQGRAAGFPASRTVSLTYCSVYAGTNSSGGATPIAIWRCNGVYDPDQPAGGHQPMGFDTWSNVYNHYTVLSSRVTATVLPTSAPTYPYVVGIYGPSDDTTIPTDSDTMRENGRCAIKLMNIDPTASASLSSSFNMKRFFGKTVDMGNVSAPVTTNPAEEAYWTLFVKTMNPGISSATVFAQVKITYRVRFYEPKDQAQN